MLKSLVDIVINYLNESEALPAVHHYASVFRTIQHPQLLDIVTLVCF